MPITVELGSEVKGNGETSAPTISGWPSLDIDQRERCFQLYVSGMLTVEVATQLGMPLATLQRRCREWRYQRIAVVKEVNEPVMPDSPSLEYDNFVVAKTNDFIVISDIEIPDHDPVMLEAALYTAMSQNIKTLIIAGDLLATDNSSLNSWAETWAVGNQINYEGSIGIAVQILARFLSWFDSIIVIEGNHDDRVNRATGGEVWFGMLLKEAESIAKTVNAKVMFSHYEYCYAETWRGMVYIAHPSNYSQTPVKLGQEMYATENGPYWDPRVHGSRRDSCHVVIAHTHIQQSGWSKDYAREIHSTGTMRDPVRTKYMRKKANKFPQWNQGFLMCKNGWFTQLGRNNTNWVHLLGSFADQAEISQQLLIQYKSAS